MLVSLTIVSWAAAGDVGHAELGFDAPDILAGKTAGLKDRLERGLKARRPSEFQFIGRVVKLVEVGRLPIRLVNDTFFWARSRRSHPFQYFEAALRLRAKRLGIEI